MEKRIETKEVVRTETITETKYVAFDGTEFNKENDCFDYEAEQIFKRDDIIVFDELKDISPLYSDPYNDYDYIWIMPTTEEAVDLINEYYNEYNEDIKVNHAYGIILNYPLVISVENLMNDVINFFNGMNIEVTFNKKGDK